MSDVKSGRVHILRQLAVPGGVAAEDAGNHFLLSVTRRSERCRSGSEIPSAGLYERQSAERRSRGVAGCGIRGGLMVAGLGWCESHRYLQIYFASDFWTTHKRVPSRTFQTT